jgi:hypothetical protein
MREISREELEKILVNHLHWIKEDCEGWEEMRANLSGANLYGANLYRADLSGADLSGANLSRAYLSGANLYAAKNISYIPMACPDSGAFIAWKKASGYIVKLFIPSDAKRLSATGRKCRCDKATVISIENPDGTTADITEVASDYDSSFKYVVHGHVSVDNFCEDRWQECSAGIHFFINREEAVNYRS